ncbi:3-hydroxyacyl-CoA dehydrogenase/enoyl-CoA hydratase family protein [Halarchaeum nitratireducens]|uniref:enoyl-CoA hydratase n=1 Tax=Halarchaeum nitratireducens TaxID=489913 RepID=A0A830GB15_9EURY|nr:MULTISPECIES: 3-hydroxyacyl-CoA dehydrogenase/enoyl-CoA hydratase family protein [Halarchaeum]MBP2250597.1 enoyl-CoA hydratase/3-hydroxyacyl-CoA dehydrogenase [Halarchaeum solikamskense]GGN15523.1 3-hydroxyacyl-CoA dehydrogenase [Halarchaeum nitratireducens]
MDREEVETVAVLGAGTMGHGIAEVAALAGFEVALRDIREEFVRAGYERIEASLARLAERDELTSAEADAALERIEPVVELEAAVTDADVVVETVPEKRDVKRNVYREVDQYLDEDAILTTNTSALSITELSEVVDRPESFCGMHFFNPPVRMQLVEVTPGAHTHDETVETVMGLARAMGKTPMRVARDEPGFVVNRIVAPLLNEAAWLVHEGVASAEEVDATARYGIGLPSGVLRLADDIGLDVLTDVLGYLHEQLGAAYEPCPLLLERAEAGDLGEKTGAGFYEYDEDGRPVTDIPSDAVRADVEDRLLAVMANETAKLVEADVASPTEIDEALMLGAGFPEGPGKLADRAGLTSLYETLAGARSDAPRYEPADELVERAGAGETFHHEISDAEGESFGDLSLEITDRVGRVTLDRPHRGNTITRDLLDELVEAVETLETDPEVRAILLTGAGEGTFSVGADIQRIAGDADAIDGVELARQGQRAFAALEESGMPVVAGIDGDCFGGGMELAAAADLRVAGRGASFGQTEHDFGLLPGWGGTQRLPDLIGESRATEVILTADRYDAETMARYGFVNELVEADAVEAEARELARDLAAGPPIAQRYTKRAIRAGRESRTAGLEVEAHAFGQLLNTEDLVEGVAAYLGDHEPTFDGT